MVFIVLRRAVGNRVALMGNIRPTETMLMGTPEDVAENVKACLREAVRKYGKIG